MSANSMASFSTPFPDFSSLLDLRVAEFHQLEHRVAQSLAQILVTWPPLPSIVRRNSKGVGLAVERIRDVRLHDSQTCRRRPGCPCTKSCRASRVHPCRLIDFVSRLLVAGTAAIYAERRTSHFTGQHWTGHNARPFPCADHGSRGSNGLAGGLDPSPRFYVESPDHGSEFFVLRPGSWRFAGP